MLCTVFCEHFDYTSCTSLSFSELEFQFSIPLQSFTNQTRSEGQSYLAVIAQQNQSHHLLITSFSLLLKFRNHSLTDYLNFIEKTKVAKGTMLVSMDVTSLYTNIPQEEGINILCKTYQTFHLNKPPIPNLYLRDMPILKENSFQRILPFVTEYRPSVPNLKNILMSKWHLIENQPVLREIYKDPPLLSYRKGRSLENVLVRAKL